MSDWLSDIVQHARRPWPLVAPFHRAFCWEVVVFFLQPLSFVVCKYTCNENQITSRGQIDEKESLAKVDNQERQRHVENGQKVKTKMSSCCDIYPLLDGKKKHD